MSTKQNDYEVIKHWDFENEVINEHQIQSKPIPMSYEGEMTMQAISDFMGKRKKTEVPPIFSGDDQAIFCFSRILAWELLKKGHSLLKFTPERRYVVDFG